MKPIPWDDLPPALKLEEVGEILRIGRNSIYKAAKTGDIPTFRVGKLILVPTAKLREMLGC